MDRASTYQRHSPIRNNRCSLYEEHSEDNSKRISYKSGDTSEYGAGRRAPKLAWLVLPLRQKPFHLTYIFLGSGFILNAFGESVPFIAHLLSHPLLESYPLVILDCDYAKAPEYPSPAQTDDARDVLEYVFSRPEEFNLDRVTLGGFSGGATLALGVGVAVGKEVREGKPFGGQSLQGHPIKAIVAFYPPTEWDSRPEVQLPPGVTIPGVNSPKSITDILGAAYFFPPGPLTKEEEAKRKEERLRSPLLTPRWADPRDFPKEICLITCEYDPRTVESEKLRAELTKAEYGKEVSGWITKMVSHAWDVAVIPDQPGFEEREKAYDLAARIIAKVGGVSSGE